MMKTIHYNEIKEQLNNCYESWDPNWEHNIGNENLTKAFKYHLEQNAGLKLDYEVETRSGKLAYKVNSVEIVHEPLFVMWLLRWA